MTPKSREARNTVARSLGMSAVAKEAGLGRESLYKALGESGNPEFATVLKLMKAMGLKLSALPIDEA
jgi:probable addiction module antidote protein